MHQWLRSWACTLQISSISALISYGCCFGRNFLKICALFGCKYVQKYIVVINVRKKTLINAFFMKKIKNVCKRDKKRYPIFTCF